MKLIRGFVMMIAGAVAVYGGILAWNSAPLELTRVEVAGNEKVPKEELVGVSGLQRGDHLLEISTAEVARKVEKIPWIRSARVERIIPSRVRISVRERTPAAEVLVGSSGFLVDEDGVILEAAGPNTTEIPQISDVPISDPAPGARVGVAQFREALTALNELDGELRSKVRLTKAATVDGITFVLDDGVLILFGAAENVPEKNRAIKAVLDDAAKRGVAVASLDVRVPSRPALRPR